MGSRKERLPSPSAGVSQNSECPHFLAPLAALLFRPLSELFIIIFTLLISSEGNVARAYWLIMRKP